VCVCTYTWCYARECSMWICTHNTHSWRSAKERDVNMHAHLLLLASYNIENIDMDMHTSLLLRYRRLMWICACTVGNTYFFCAGKDLKSRSHGTVEHCSLKHKSDRKGNYRTCFFLHRKGGEKPSQPTNRFPELD
jgi:hypothetical protein